MLKLILRWTLQCLYQVEIRGKENLHTLSKRTLIVSNHTSFLDALLIYAFLPVPATFAINTYVARSRVGRIAALFANLFPMDPTNPLSIRALIRRIKQGGCVVIFPEGRITVTGALMKVYQGPGLVAERSQATVVPVRIDGAQYSRFSRLGKRSRICRFPKITLNVQPPRCLVVDSKFHGRARREKAGRLLSELMADMMFETANLQETLTERLLNARKIHGGKHIIAEDINRTPISYNNLLTRVHLIGHQLAKHIPDTGPVGVMLPSTLAGLVAFWGLQFRHIVPAMLNYTIGSQGVASACTTANINTILTSRKFIEQADLGDIIHSLESHITFIYLEDLVADIRWYHKMGSAIASHLNSVLLKHSEHNSHRPAVILFTSGSEGVPKGVVLSHQNLVSNIHQLTSRIDFNAQDIALNALPLFHSFGLTAGMLLPLTCGVRVFLYPSPLHYRVVPEIAYEINATIMFGTNTFLSGYARFADPYDFYSLRYVFAGAEKLQEEVRRTWSDKFGVRIFEGYGATETSPVIAGNTPLANRPGSVGKLMPGMDYRLIKLAGLANGQKLQVRGPNVMLGYLLNDQPGVMVPPSSDLGDGWYDTGDIVTMDEDGFITICGRAKRFAKVAGEMVSLTAVEVLASHTWPDAIHAAVTIPDNRKGEQVLLYTTCADANRADLLQRAKQDGVGEIALPRQVIPIVDMPVLGTGKTDYVAVQQLAEVLS